MIKWSFPSRNNGQIEGFTNPGHAWFKGDPLLALAREICQNSLDAVDDETKPVKIVFNKSSVKTQDFPGTAELLDIIYKCADYWKNSHNENIEEFVNRATTALKDRNIDVLRISDYNTIGLQGAFDTENITPWVGLVKSIGVNVKSNDTAAGSYGIGKAAAFVNSDVQTVFYRTKDLEGNTAAQGVANLMAFIDDSYGDEDPVRRSTGFYGNSDKNLPVVKMEQLDAIYARDEVGTDIFIPGFHWNISRRVNWIEIMTGEIIENFLMSIHYGKLSVRIADTIIDKAHLNEVVARNQKLAKEGYCFNKVLNAKDDEVIEEVLEFHDLGSLRLRLLYAADLNKKILVVRKSGMRIANIRALPKGMSYTGILELQGEQLNKFFRKMENPQHNSWDPERHNNPKLAKQYKKEVEDWVKETICKKLEEASGEESVIDVGDCFNTATHTENEGKSETREKILDSTKSVEILFQRTKHKKTSNSAGGMGNTKVRGRTTDDGSLFGHRHRSGKQGGNPTGRSGEQDNSGKDSVYTGYKEVSVSARVITRGDGNNRLVVKSHDDLHQAVIEIMSVGENGKSLPVKVQSILSGNASVRDGKIVISGLVAGRKEFVDFLVHGQQNYAMGVRVYGN